MSDVKHKELLEKLRVKVARRVHRLRKERRWTQAELARQLHVSQGRLSELERGDGSFTAEQLLTMMRVFNAPLEDFVSDGGGVQGQLQNALVRLGAQHLRETSAVPTTDRFSSAAEAIRETIAGAPSPRLVAALAPVLVVQVDRLNLPQLAAQLGPSGLERRLAWVVDNTLEALRLELPAASSPARRQYNRAQLILGSFLNLLPVPSSQVAAPDILDGSIRSHRSLQEVAAAASAISQKWGIVSSLQPDDFVRALRDAHVGVR